MKKRRNMKTTSLIFILLKPSEMKRCHRKAQGIGNKLRPGSSKFSYIFLEHSLILGEKLLYLKPLRNMSNLIVSLSKYCFYFFAFVSMLLFLWCKQLVPSENIIGFKKFSVETIFYVDNKKKRLKYGSLWVKFG